MVGVVGFEPTVSRFRSEHSGPTELYPDDGAHDGNRTRPQPLDRRCLPPGRNMGKLEDREGVEPILFCGLKSRCPHREATGPIGSRTRYRPSVFRLSTGCTDFRALRDLVSRCGFDPLLRRERFYRPHARATGFPCPNWSHRSDSNRGRPDTNGLHCHCATAAWRSGRYSKPTPRGAQGLAIPLRRLPDCALRCWRKADVSIATPHGAISLRTSAGGRPG